VNNKSIRLFCIGFGGVEEWISASGTEKVHEMVVPLTMIIVVEGNKGRIDYRGLAVFTLMCEFLSAQHPLNSHRDNLDDNMPFPPTRTN
jgi:hypothetical protein